MAVTVPSTWSYQQEREVTPGGPICLTGSHDLATLNQRINRAWAHTRRQVFACGGLGGGVLGSRSHTESGVTGYQLRYAGVAPFWSASGRFTLHVYGQLVDVRCDVGGQFGVPVSCGATLGWYSSTFDLSSMLLADDAVTIEVLAKGNAVVGSRYWSHWVLEEEPRQSLPTHGDSETRFGRLDDAAFVVDGPLDAFLLQRLEQNVDDIERLRTRGTCLIHPYNEPVQFSSGWWRSDGPWSIDVDPWCDRITVALYVQVPDQDVQVTAFSEWEDKATALARAVTVTATGSQQVVFTGLLAKPSDAGPKRTKVWVGFKSAVGGPVAYSPATVVSVEWGGERKWTLLDASALAPSLPQTESRIWPVGRTLLVEADRVGFTSGEKGALTQSSDYVENDLSANLFDPSPDAEHGQIFVSPNNHADERSSPAILHPVSVYECGVLYLYSVALACSRSRDVLSDDQLYAAAAVGSLPPWGVAERVRQRVNQVARFGTPQVICRHRGQQWLEGPFTGAGKTYTQRGRYTFASGAAASPGPVVERFVVLDPTLLVGLNPSLLRVRATYLVVRLSQGDDVTLTWTLRHGGSTQGTTIQDVFARSATADAPCVSQWDAAIAAICYSKDSGGIYEHSYVHQVGFLQRSEEFDGRFPWGEVVVECGFPATSPEFVYLHVESSDTKTWVIVTDVSAEICERG